MRSCAYCKYAQPIIYGAYICKHPSAMTVDRVYGEQFPAVGAPFLAGKDPTLEKCDANGWFEERKSWFERIFG